MFYVIWFVIYAYLGNLVHIQKIVPIAIHASKKTADAIICSAPSANITFVGCVLEVTHIFFLISIN